MNKSILVTGFEPLYNLKRSPSGDLVTTLTSGSFNSNGLELTGLVLPQLFRQDAQIVLRTINQIQPQYVVMFGVSGGIRNISLEKLAVNFENTATGDNSKIPVIDRTIEPNGPAAYATPVNVKLLNEAMSLSSIETDVSYNAGTHTCNSLYYQVLSAFFRNDISSAPLFVHIPFPSNYAMTDDLNNYSDIQELAGDIVQLLNLM